MVARHRSGVRVLGLMGVGAVVSLVPHKVVVVVPTGFSLLELGIAVEAFAICREGLGGGWYDVSVCSARPGPLASRGGMFSASIRHGLEALDRADTVIVPQSDESEFPAAPEVVAALQRAHRRGARLVSMWTGVFVLAQAGVLDGREVAVHWKYARRFAASYPQVEANPAVLYIDDEDVVTSAGTASGIDVSLHLIRKDHGARAARHVARCMVIAPHRDGSQSQYLLTPLQEAPARPDAVATAMEHALRNLHRDVRLEELAQTASMSVRHFSRRFREVTGTSPARWLTIQKLSRAQAMLEGTDYPIEYVASSSGFSSAVTFRQRFTQAMQASPASYRRAFRTREAS